MFLSSALIASSRSFSASAYLPTVIRTSASRAIAAGWFGALSRTSRRIVSASTYLPVSNLTRERRTLASQFSLFPSRILRRLSLASLYLPVANWSFASASTSGSWAAAVEQRSPARTRSGTSVLLRSGIGVSNNAVSVLPARMFYARRSKPFAPGQLYVLHPRMQDEFSSRNEPCPFRTRQAATDSPARGRLPVSREAAPQLEGP
jgi:hypothetical protein